MGSVICWPRRHSMAKNFRSFSPLRVLKLVSDRWACGAQSGVQNAFRSGSKDPDRILYSALRTSPIARVHTSFVGRRGRYCAVALDGIVGVIDSYVPPTTSRFSDPREAIVP